MGTGTSGKEGGPLGFRAAENSGNSSNRREKELGLHWA